MSALQELAGYTGGDVSFLKEDVELQVNRRLFWDSVGHGTPAKRKHTCAAGALDLLLCAFPARLKVNSGAFACL